MLFHLRSLSSTQLTFNVHSSVQLLQYLETVSDVRMDLVVEEGGVTAEARAKHLMDACLISRGCLSHENVVVLRFRNLA